MFARLMNAEMFLQRNKIGTHVLDDRIAVEARGRLMGRRRVEWKTCLKNPYKKSLIGANKTGLAQADPYVLVLALHNVSERS